MTALGGPLPDHSMAVRKRAHMLLNGPSFIFIHSFNLILCVSITVKDKSKKIACKMEHENFCWSQTRWGGDHNMTRRQSKEAVQGGSPRRQSRLCGNYGRLCWKFHVWGLWQEGKAVWTLWNFWWTQAGLCGNSAGVRQDEEEIAI